MIPPFFGKQDVGIWWVKKRFPRYGKFMICYWSVHCMLRSSLWFVTGQNTVRYDQVYDLLLVSTLYATTILVYDLLLVRTINLVEYNINTAVNVYETITYRNIQCYDQQQIVGLVVTYGILTSNKTQVYDLLLVRTLYGMTKFMICYWSVHCMLRSSLWFVTGQNVVCNKS
jgi:hypothetical protein